jgi:uncharacterized membrane protein
MADDKEKDEGMDGQTFAFAIFGLFVVVMVLGTVLERKGMTNFLALNPDPDSVVEDANVEDLSIEQQFLSSSLSLGDNVTNIDPVIVRQSPAGSPIGRQNAGTKGRLMEGPVDRFDTSWWRVDYENAPDGWVEFDLLTTKGWQYTAFNIIPITFGLLRPVAIIFTVIIIILIFIVILKTRDLNKTEAKKEAVKSDQEIYKKGHEDKSDSDLEKDSDSIDDAGLPVPGLPIGEKPATAKPSNRRWENIQSLINSYNSNDWKQAIIESDTILDEMVQKMGYKGDSLGERLKQVEQSDFTSINQAWEAHKIRNRIAHSGSNFVMSKDEAERVIGLYKQVFSEFYYI